MWSVTQSTRSGIRATNFPFSFHTKSGEQAGLGSNEPSRDTECKAMAEESNIKLKRCNPQGVCVWGGTETKPTQNHKVSPQKVKPPPLQQIPPQILTVMWTPTRSPQAHQAGLCASFCNPGGAGGLTPLQCLDVKLLPPPVAPQSLLHKLPAHSILL